ncbi:MaoC family dehydratase N-terminal domain-containing protein [Aquabacter sp. L1I39]|uniref:FAS1-like dehydratase domain-containing protein n=1 Tax=Aquabacter sp. L1I39 TaxID=2820278 RepID=UPI001ADD0C3A|nr:MaoC family dehydratase N-terminal domain-containing protein [Aquabacter sp. L1I39]QTL05509.1 MaoC family dehydratase N-terminal domain-containing protein [Aquabacter sp. L1I39]
MSEIDRSLIGMEMAPFMVEVERGAVRKFARAIGDTNPLFHDPAFARAQGHADILAPPTFPITFRPPHEAPWLAPLDRRRILAGSVSFTYERPVMAGMRLVCRFAFAALEERRGSKGPLEVMRQEVRVDDEAGHRVVTCGRATLYRSLQELGLPA